MPLTITYDPAAQTLRATCGDFATSGTADEVVSEIRSALALSPDEGLHALRDWEDGYVHYDVSAYLGGEHAFTAACWRRVGWLEPGASADLDGSGLQSWGSSRPYAELSVLASDGMAQGDEALGDEWVAWLRAAAADVLRHVRMYPDADDIADLIELAARSEAGCAHARRIAARLQRMAGDEE